MSDKLGLDQFRELCRQEFRFLEDEYGFAEPEPPQPPLINQFQVHYANATTLVIVAGINWGEAVDVRIGRVKPEPWETYGNYSLEDLLAIRCPDLSLIRPDGSVVRNGQAFEIEHYARALKQCADDVLRGEFPILPKLHEAIERRRTGRKLQNFREWIGLWKAVITGWLVGPRRWLRRRLRK